MKNIIYLISLLSFLLLGCDQEIETKEFPVVLTLSVSNNNSSGATFRGELLKEGLSPTTSYGFIWNSVEPTINESYKVILGTKFVKGVFNCRFSDSLSSGVDYYIKAFATYDDKTVLGNTVVLHSQGSKNMPWSKVLTKINLPGIRNPYGCSNDIYGTVLFQDGAAYSYDPDKNKFSASAKFPNTGSSDIMYTSVNLDNTLYFFNNMYSNLYKLSDNKWSVNTKIPFSYSSFDGYYHSYAVDGNILILSSFKSYIYFPKTFIWEERAALPESFGNKTIGGTDLNGKAYLMTNTKNICEYDPKSDTWKLITKYPDISNDKINAFSYGNKLYFGLRLKHSSDFNLIDQNLWSFDLTTKKWELACILPAVVTYNFFFSFRIKDNFYFATKNDVYFELFKLDMSKLK